MFFLCENIWKKKIMKKDKNMKESSTKISYFLIKVVHVSHFFICIGVSVYVEESRKEKLSIFLS